MLYEITHLKAPWPAGANVGDIIDLSVLPGWAVGKCRTATDKKNATVKFEAPAPARNLAAELDAMEKAALKAADEHAAALDAMTKRAEAAEAALAKAAKK